MGGGGYVQGSLPALTVCERAACESPGTESVRQAGTKPEGLLDRVSSLPGGRVFVPESVQRTTGFLTI